MTREGGGLAQRRRTPEKKDKERGVGFKIRGWGGQSQKESNQKWWGWVGVVVCVGWGE